MVHSLPYLPPLLLGLGFILLFYFLQPPIDFRLHPLNDANKHLQLYEAFQSGELPQSVSFPFHNRLLTPFLAARMGTGHPETDFFILNSAYTVVFLLALFYLFRRLHISPGFFYINFLWLLHWLGPFRGNAADPLNTDAGVLMFQTLMLLAIYRQRHDLLMLLLPLAVLHKEVFIAWAVVYGAVLLSERIFDCEKSDGLVYVMLAIAFSVLIKWITNHMIPPLQPGRGSLITLLFNVRESLHHPVRVLRWGAAMFTAYGLFFIPLGLQLVRPWQLNRFQISLLLFFAVNLLFGLLAGDDHTRLLYLGLPFLFTLLGSTSSGTASKWFPAAMLSLPVTGLWSGVPVVPPAITGLPQWAPEYGPWGVSAFWLIAGAIGSAALIVFFYKKKPLSAFRTPGL